MQKKITTDIFIQRAIAKHGNKFDYSKVEYKDCDTNVLIGCPIHGEFTQTPYMHLTATHGCPKCYHESRKTLIFGKGVNDMLSVNKTQSYSIWFAMLQRCYDSKTQRKQPTYKGCSVCEEWLTYSNFKRWYDKNYREGYHLDKDILIKGNKIYSPETCCFVPYDINTMFTKNNKHRGKYPIGVHESHKTKGRFEAEAGNKYIGSFDTPNEAFYAYKQEKERQIKEKATDYYNRGLIEKRVRDALFRYEVEITD